MPRVRHGEHEAHDARAAETGREGGDEMLLARRRKGIDDAKYKETRTRARGEHEDQHRDVDHRRPRPPGTIVAVKDSAELHRMANNRETDDGDVFVQRRATMRARQPGDTRRRRERIALAGMLLANSATARCEPRRSDPPSQLHASHCTPYVGD